ncbi:MAG: tetratricopeptide repeat protein, partial [Planctomycetaceae bacterium]
MSESKALIREALKSHQAGDLAAARTVYERVLASEPANAEALHLLGVVCLQEAKNQEAVDLIQQAVILRDDQAAWFGNLGTAKSALNDLPGAVAAYEAALRLKPDHVESHYNIAHVYSRMGDRTAAEASYREALRLAPEHVGAKNNLATCLREQGRSGEAIELLETLLADSPQFAEGWYNLGNALRDLDRIDEAIVSYERAMELAPESADVKASLGMAQLATGDFERGLPLYEFRQQARGGGVSDRCQPRWDGSSVSGKRVMLFSEQGLGDTLQFVRFAKLLRDAGATVYLECQRPLKIILETSHLFDGVFASDESLPEFDVAAPLLSLPLLLETRAETIPADVPYLEPASQLVSTWSERLAQIDGFKVGIAWQGAPGHLSDVRRSFSLREFETIAAVPGVSLVALQKGFGLEQVSEVSFPIHELGDDHDESNGAFMDTAAVMANLDLVITSDTSVAHLAGAMGVPVWIAMSTGSDWRWMSGRDDSPWYPTARLYRQTEAGEWASVFERMREDVQQLVGESSTRRTEAEVRIEVSVGELLDKITILEIKSERIGDEAKLRNIRRELDSLER